MAYQIGTASSHLDLLDQLRVFLTTNSDLVAAGQNWSTLRNQFGLGPYAWPLSRIAFTNQGTNTNFPDAMPGALANKLQAIKITGTFNAANAGTYTFGIDTSGTAELLIDGAVVVSDYVDSSSATSSWSNTGSVSLTAGTHSFEYRFSMGGLGSTYITTRLGLKGPSDSSMTFMPISLVSSPMYSFETLFSGTETTHADMNAVFSTRSLLLKGPGLAGADNIYVNLCAFGNVTGDYYNIVGYSATSYDATKLVDQQSGCSAPKMMYLWNQSMSYWFIANGRRFIVICRVASGVYETFYGGFILPYGTPSEFPYPIAIGGCGATTFTNRWSYQGYEHRAFFDPGYPATLELRDPSNNQLTFCNETYGSYQSTANGSTYPYLNNPGYRSSPDLNYALSPIVLMGVKGRLSQTYGNVYGELDGVYHISGFGNSAESVINIGGVNYLAIQSAYRNGYNDFAAFALA